MNLKRENMEKGSLRITRLTSQGKLFQTAVALYDELPIGKDDARFLELHPGQPTDPLACDLFVRPIDCYKLKWGDVDLPQSHIDRRVRGYRALSYAWGDSAAVCPIQCNGHGFKIARSLYSALEHLRSSDTSQILWADALCINQSDIAERNVQLSKIGKIYEFADSVFVWLGQGSSKCTRVIGFLQRVYDVCWSFRDQQPGRPKVYFEVKLDSESKEVQQISSMLGLDEMSLSELAENLGGLEDLFSRPWFRRIWIRQEIAKAYSVDVACGDARISWTSLTKGIEQAAIIVAPKGLKIDLERIHRTLNGLDIGWARSSNTRTQSQLLDLLHGGRRAEASVPHDKVYALMGMASDTFVDSLGADYEKPVSEVFENVAKFLINRDGLLDVIYAAEATRAEAKEPFNDLSSWVPNWAVPSDVSDLLLNRRGRNFGVSRYTCKPRHDIGENLQIQAAEERRQGFLRAIADRGREARIDNDQLEPYWNWAAAPPHVQNFEKRSVALSQCRQQKGLLKVQGYEWDWVHELTNEIDPAQLQVLANAGDTGMFPFWERIHKSWVARIGRLKFGRIAHMDFAAFREAVIRPLTIWNSKLASETLLRDVDEMGYDATTTQRDAKRARRQAILLAKLVNRLQNRRTCVSENGHFCIVPFTTQPGDAICLLHGGQLPCVLRAIPGDASHNTISAAEERRTSSTILEPIKSEPERYTRLISSHRYQFIGGCFVEGDTQGEALEACLKAAAELISFLLV